MSAPTPAPDAAAVEARATLSRASAMLRFLDRTADRTPAETEAILAAFGAGWETGRCAPPLPWLYRTWRPAIATAFRAGRAARRRYERAQAASAAGEGRE